MFKENPGFNKFDREDSCPQVPYMHIEIVKKLMISRNLSMVLLDTVCNILGIQGTQNFSHE